jgi:hypothetical protein
MFGIFKHVVLLLMILLDAHWLYSVSPGDRTVQARSYRRDVLKTVASARTTDEAGCAGIERSAQTTRSRSRDGKQSLVHGDEGSPKAWSDDNDELHAWCNAKES